MWMEVAMKKSPELQAFVDWAAKEMFGWNGDDMCCRICNSRIIVDEFRDELSRKEFDISGMCQRCQDDTFGGEE